MPLELRKLTNTEQLFVEKIISRAIASKQAKKTTRIKGILANLATFKLDYDLDGNFTICLLKQTGSVELFTGSAKRNPKRDSYNEAIGKEVALRCAINNLIGVSNEYARKHETRNFVEEKTQLDALKESIKQVRSK